MPWALGPPSWADKIVGLFLCYGTFIMGKISVFVDESGDYGKLGRELINSNVSYQDNFYIVSFVFHEQTEDIFKSLANINHLYSDYEVMTNDVKQYIHFGPLIRRENNFYKQFSPETIRKIIISFSRFLQYTNIYCYVIVLDKREVHSQKEFEQYFIDKLNIMFINNRNIFRRNQTAIEYYDSGQAWVKHIIAKGIEPHFVQNDRRMHVNPANYRLFQACDFLCTIKLIEIKRKAEIYSGIEKTIFNDKKVFKRILNIIKDKSLY